MPTPQKEADPQGHERADRGRSRPLPRRLQRADRREASPLRRKMRESGVQFRVIKNTLLKRVVRRSAGSPSSMPYLEGPTRPGFSRTARWRRPKILAEFAKEHERPREGRGRRRPAVRRKDDRRSSRRCPAARVLLAQVLGTFIAPMTQFLGARQRDARDCRRAWRTPWSSEKTKAS